MAATPEDSSLGGRADEFLHHIESIFLSADSDRSGALDRKEFATVVHQLYRTTNKYMRSRRSVQQEVDVAMALFDGDGDGLLDFEEMSQMICSGENEAFKLQLEPGLKACVVARISAWQEAQPHDCPLPWCLPNPPDRNASPTPTRQHLVEYAG